MFNVTLKIDINFEKLQFFYTFKCRGFPTNYFKKIFMIFEFYVN